MLVTRTAILTAGEIRSGDSSGAVNSPSGSATGISFVSGGSVRAGLGPVRPRREKAPRRSLHAGMASLDISQDVSQTGVPSARLVAPWDA